MIYKYGQHFESEKFADLLHRSFWNSSLPEALNSVSVTAIYVSGVCSGFSANHFEFSQQSWKWALLFSTKLREGK